MQNYSIFTTSKLFYLLGTLLIAGHKKTPQINVRLCMSYS